MKKDNSTLILLVLAGLGIYWYFKNKKAPVTVVTPTGTAANDTSMVAAPTQDSDYNVKFSINGMKKLGNVPNTI